LSGEEGSPEKSVVPSPRDGTLVALLTALPLALTLAICLGLIYDQGGIEPTTWLAAALLELALAVTVLTVGIRVRVARGARWALVTLTTLVLWSYLSISWADVRAPAWDGANLTLFYLLAFGTLALWPLRVVPAAAAMTAFGIGLTAVGAITLAEGAGAADPAAVVIYARRLSEPLGYPNATAVVFGMGAWLMLGLSLQSWLARWWRGLAVGLAVALAQFDFLAQSRGAVYTTPFVLIVYFTLARRRIRAAAPLAILALVSAPAVPKLLDVYDSVGAAEQRAALTSAGWTIAACALVAALVATVLLPVLDRAVEPGPLARRRLRVGGLAAAALVTLLLLAFAAPGARLERGWDQFKSDADPLGGTRLGGLGSGRYDMWRVALSEFERHPVQGIGVDNFAVPYLQQRRGDEQPEYPHSLVVRMLSQVGLVGSALLLAFVVFGFRLSAGPESPARGIAAAGIVAFMAWLLHSSVDWLWEIPACGLTAFALLGLAAGVQSTSAEDGRRQTNWTRALGAAAAVAAAAVTFALPWLGARYEDRAAATWRSDPVTAFAELDRAGALNRLSAKPFLLSGAIASRLDDYQRMRSSFERALRRNPVDWYAHLELAIALSRTSDRRGALRHAARAAELNPREAIVGQVLADLRSGRVVDPRAIDRAILARIRAL
jgi:hypothetical protein